MANLNLLAGWIGILCGVLSGAIHGLWFHRVDWLGGYASWPRRLTRLGHISFFGLGFINLAFAWSLPAARLNAVTDGAAWSLVVGAVTMPACCYLTAFRPQWRHAFVVPVVSLVAGVVMFICGGLLP